MYMEARRYMECKKRRGRESNEGFRCDREQTVDVSISIHTRFIQFFEYTTGDIALIVAVAFLLRKALLPL